MKRLLVLLAACTPTQEPLGETLWTVKATNAGSSHQVGPGGHLARGITFLDLVSPDGVVVWERSCDGPCGVPAVDRDGNIYRISARNMTERTLTKHAAADGAVAWTRSIEVSDGVTSVAVDANQDVWWLTTSMTPVDFGGGPIEAAFRERPFGRYAPDGTFQSGGSLPLLGRSQLIPVPAGGFITNDTFDSGTIIAFDETGRITSRLERPPEHTVHDVALHETGELSLVETDFSTKDRIRSIVRFDADRVERWRRRCNGCEKITPITGGIALVSGGDGLVAGSSDAQFLSRFDPDGHMRREIIDADFALYSGPVLDTYRLRIADSMPVPTIIAARLLDE